MYRANVYCRSNAQIQRGGRRGGRDGGDGGGGRGGGAQQAVHMRPLSGELRVHEVRTFGPGVMVAPRMATIRFELPVKRKSQ